MPHAPRAGGESGTEMGIHRTAWARIGGLGAWDNTAVRRLGPPVCQARACSTALDALQGLHGGTSTGRYVTCDSGRGGGEWYVGMHIIEFGGHCVLDASLGLLVAHAPATFPHRLVGRMG